MPSGSAPPRPGKKPFERFVSLLKSTFVTRSGIAEAHRPVARMARASGSKPKPTRRDVKKALTALHKETTQKRIRYHKAYQPIWVGAIRSKKTIRDCEDRWSMVRRSIEETGSRSVVDLGCAEGFFVRKAGEMGCFAVGVDRDYNRLGLIESARMIDRSEHSAFMLADIDLPLLGNIPQFDTVLCFSVMHHIIRRNSFEHGLAILKAIRSRTGKAFIFDMGQTNEISTSWVTKLPDMGADPQNWIEGFLRAGGFAEVRCIGKTDAFQDEVDRHVFECRP
jgi:2-polyprenyl-3-methyl-5-hydroxy-6-metoxy-1,4-benzoquinol methylase